MQPAAYATATHTAIPHVGASRTEVLYTASVVQVKRTQLYCKLQQCAHLQRTKQHLIEEQRIEQQRKKKQRTQYQQQHHKTGEVEMVVAGRTILASITSAVAVAVAVAAVAVAVAAGAAAGAAAAGAAGGAAAGGAAAVRTKTVHSSQAGYSNLSKSVNELFSITKSLIQCQLAGRQDGTFISLGSITRHTRKRTEMVFNKGGATLTTSATNASRKLAVFSMLSCRVVGNTLS